MARALALLVVFALSIAIHAETIKGLEDLGLEYTAVKREFKLRGAADETAYRHATDNYLVDVTLKNLTPAQIEMLAKILPKRASGPTVRLEELLPEMALALTGKQFRPVEEDFLWPVIDVSDEELTTDLEDIQNFGFLETKLGTYINCWTTAYELLRTWKSGESVMDVMWLSRSTADEALTKEYGVQVRDELQFGDYIVFEAYDSGSGEELVQHVAIFVLPGLYWEKTDSTQDDAFRFILEDDLLTKYRQLFGDQLKTHHFRLKNGVELPRLSETRNLWAVYGAVYSPYFSEADLNTITFEFDWMPGMNGTTKPEFWPYRIHSIGFAGGMLATDSTISEAFQQPLQD